MPFYTKFLKKECEDLLRRTPLVVELYDVEDTSLGANTRQPSDLEAFDSTFRCEDSSQPNAQWTQNESREPDYGFWIFDWGMR